MSQAYRSLFYKEYYTKQVGRFQGITSQSKLTIEVTVFALEIVPLLSNNKQATILDIGCGFGSFLSAAKQAGYTNTIGIDTSAEQVDIAHQLGITEVVQEDAFTYLQKYPNHFDTITALDVLEHFTKDEAVSLLHHVLNALKPGGKLILRTPNADSPMSSVYLFGDFTHELILNASSAHQLLVTCGFQNIHIQKAFTQSLHPIKRLFQQTSWWLLELAQKWKLFATARTTKGMVFTPNMIAVAHKSVS
ncbi:MAG: class I SAM-dependent methyltransferase [Bacteroidia bacterium]|jgi:2-polyprenyl-3-methyl-5-hydroxy-6-metoxy-1,4-benzoquinol methylase|nr:class I SAM-dependent methyltransferase [Bacteroidia bacterium]